MYCFNKEEFSMDKFKDIVNRNWNVSFLSKDENDPLEDMRAKMFLSFDALAGLKDGVEDRKVRNVQKSKLSKDRIESLDYSFNEAMHNLLEGKKVFAVVCYFYQRTKSNGVPLGFYEVTQGCLSEISSQQKCLKINNVFIAFDDIMDFSFRVI